jgi:protein tyrosine kinase modulator
MLQKQSFQEQLPDEEDNSFLSLPHLMAIVKRRFVAFFVPFVVILAAGSAVALFWPATYLSQGTILVESQQIPSNLVEPTVAAATNERILAIEQRIMTRDNLLAIAQKFHMFTDWRQWLSGTDIVDFIRKRTVIKPVELKLGAPSRNGQVLAFTVGFEHEQPAVAAKVANELITMILREDVQTRTGFATETVRFLEQEVQQLEGQVSAIDSQIGKLRGQQADSVNPEALSAEKSLIALKQELAIKSATESNTHPEIQALKRKIKALEKIAGDEKVRTLGIDALESRRAAFKKDLINASEKLAAARLGESLERGQHSERLEAIEQPTLPLTPVSPNRPKIFAFALALALMAGGGLAFALEMFDTTIRSSTDLFKMVDRHLVVAIPYIATRAEERRKKRSVGLMVGLSMVVVAGGLAAAYFLLPVDIIFDKIMNHLPL